MNHLYTLGNITAVDRSSAGRDTLWCCAYSPYILCKRCPLYQGIRLSHSPALQERLEVSTSTYSAYVRMYDACDNHEIPSQRCRNTPWRNMRPVVEVKPQTQEI
jgi:hypothetical protein